MKAQSFSLFTLLTLSTYSFGETYVVKKGDTFSKVLGSNIPGLVFGKDGSFERIRKLNPHIINPAHIYPGTIIFLETPKVVVAPAPERIVASEPSFTPSADLEVNPYYTMLGLSLKDKASGSHSTLASQSYIGTRFAYTQAWSERFASFVSLNLGYVNFEKHTDGAKKFSDANKFMSGIGLGIKYKHNADLTSMVEASYQKELFAHSLSTTELTVNAVAVPSVGTKVAYNIVSKGPLTLGVLSELQYKFGARTDSYQVLQGLKYGASIFVKQNDNFQTNLGIYTRAQSTSIARQTETGIMLSVQFSLPTTGKR